ncbi:MAG: hypothetical protein L3K04_02250 [Thermoplasmata archaeon]|nr:hypothetical protein [Thermoplasmata archaeon]
MPHGVHYRRARALLLLAVTLGLLLPELAPVASATSTPVVLQLSSGGSLTSNITVQLANGSALRYALDGNFSPLLDELPISGSNRSTYEAEIAGFEGNPFTAGLFGNRDGTVEPYEVTDFEQLVQQEARLLPVSVLTGGVAFQLTIDGQAASSASVQGIGISGGLGADTSTLPVEVSLLTVYTYSLSGNSHTLGLSWTLPPLLITPLLNFDVSFSTPAGDSITGSSGFGSTSVQNDLLGFAPGKFDGQLQPSGSGSASVHFAPSFPLGTFLLVAGVVGVAALACLLLLRRARRRRRTAAEPASSPHDTPAP